MARLTERMPLTDIPDPAAVAVLMQDAAAEEIMPRFRALGERDIMRKPQGDLVTAADLAVEARLTRALGHLTPGASVLGEEAAAADPLLFDLLAGAAPVWIIDPVDGTRNFANGEECFAVIVAWVAGGRTLAGWIHDPVNGVTIWAAAGEGAWRTLGGGRSMRLKLKKAPIPRNMAGSMGPKRRRHLKEMPGVDDAALPKRLVRYGCTGREYMDLATGELHFAEYFSLKPWDHAAGLLIHAEAGGHNAFTHTGEAYAPGPITRERLLIAPSEKSWHALAKLLPAP